MKELLSRRTWNELLYALLGLPLLALTGLGGRWFGYGQRALSNALAGTWPREAPRSTPRWSPS